MLIRQSYHLSFHAAIICPNYYSCLAISQIVIIFCGDRYISVSFVGKQTHHSFHDKGTGENVDIPACSTVDSSIFGVSDAGQVKKCPEYNITQDSVTMEAAVFNEGDAHNNNGRSESEVKIM